MSADLVRAAALAGTLLCSVAPPALAQDTRGSPESQQREVERATVMIVCPKDGELGVGLIVANDAGHAYIATAEHVVRACAREGLPVQVTLLQASSAAPAQVLKSMATPLDLAVLSLDAARLRAPAAVLPSSRLGDADALNRGDALFAVGQAWFSNITPELLARRDGVILQFESHSARPGSSGGPLVNDRWQVVGLVRGINDVKAEAFSIDAVISALRTWQVPISLRRQPVVSAGDERSCALTRRGDARCWSDAAIGRSPMPAVEVDTIQGLRLESISIGVGHSCGLDAAGTAYCWGANAQGQLGRGTVTEQSDEPVRVAGTLRFASISASGWHSCAIRTDGQAYCWGAGSEGRLGNDSGQDSAVPVPVAGGLHFRTISAGARNSCGITTTGEAYCWGGVMGTGIPRYGTDPPNAFVPQRVPGGSAYVAISAGGVESATCALGRDGAVLCWGEPDDKGSFAPQSFVPRKVSGALAFVTFHHGIGDHACGTLNDGRAYCWGRNDEGQLGNGSVTRSDTPVPVAGKVRFASIVAGHFQTCGVSVAGAVYCWGARVTPSAGGSTVPVKIDGFD